MSQAQALLESIKEDVIAGPYPGFIPKYFPDLDLTMAKSILKPGSAEATASQAEKDLLKSPPRPEDVLGWLNAVYKLKHGTVGNRKWRSLPSSLPIMKDCTGLSLVLRHPAIDDRNWESTDLVCHAVGDAQASYPHSLSQLYSLARQVFIAQPLRFFLHGILVCGDMVELWVFDHSGMYCTEPLYMNVEQDYVGFLSIVLCYAVKSEADLGIRPFADQDDHGAYIYVDSTDQRLYLEDEPFVDCDELFGAGIVCYRAKAKAEDSWSHVIKFKWRDSDDQPEEELLNLARERNVRGVVSLIHHAQVEETAMLRCQIRHQRCRTLHQETVDKDLPEGILRYSQEGRSYFTNRFLTRLVFSPLARPLTDFNDTLELLTVLRDAIRAHRSLLQDANILHRDISAGNIVITNSSPRGMLIDLDHSADLEIEQPVAGRIIGTKLFTAIGLLRLDAQTYRHDLESFLYLFLWVILCRGEEHLPAGSMLKPWGEESRDGSAEAKMRDMQEARFQMILDEFEPKYDCLKDVAWRLRAALFRPEEGELWLGTDTSKEGTDTIYDAMLAIFEEAIKGIDGTVSL
ncbi:hypothetical protein NLG97_g5211 [Lecanicillium saksenae]|uniref:Uncharacterized protein n=1 Tax=Lecanicillium saksenae TaxID=468837 RepID=A0ACC1QVJ1_9HYPO|nr:hypothetical protein NLG97_g5211 [Lecanicillium saksenae]